MIFDLAETNGVMGVFCFVKELCQFDVYIANLAD